MKGTQRLLTARCIYAKFVPDVHVVDDNQIESVSVELVYDNKRNSQTRIQKSRSTACGRLSDIFYIFPRTFWHVNERADRQLCVTNERDACHPREFLNNVTRASRCERERDDTYVCMCIFIRTTLTARINLETDGQLIKHS